MLDFRLRKPASALNWRYQEIVVTQEYLDEHAADLNLIELDYAYSVGSKVLDIYFNGNRLVEGGGYEEVDTLHVRFDIRAYDTAGNLVTKNLELADEIVIKEWFNADSVLYGATGINTRLTTVEIEVHNARMGFPRLKDKLTDMDRELANLLGEGNYEIGYEYDPANDEDIVKEIVTGDYAITKDYVYNDVGKPVTEIITHGNKVTTRDFTYDVSTERIIKVTSVTVTV
jgi:hypothetical protein